MFYIVKVDVTIRTSEIDQIYSNSNMFDLAFYASVCGFVKYIHELMHNTLPNPEGYGRVGIYNYFAQKVCSISILSQTGC